MKRSKADLIPWVKTAAVSDIPSRVEEVRLETSVPAEVRLVLIPSLRY